MSRLLVGLLLAFALIAVPARGHQANAAAPVVCGSTPVSYGDYPALSVPPRTYVTGACVLLANGQTYTVIPNGTTPIAGGCYVVYKGSSFASTGRGGAYGPFCSPIQRLTVRVAKSIG